MISQTGIDAFLDSLASAAPTPGGGSAAALMGATGAALLTMVCNVTLGKKEFAASAADLQDLRAAVEPLRRRLTAMMTEDIAAFDGLMGAYKRPKASDEEKAARSAAIQLALQDATLAPLECCRACAAVIALARRAATLGFTGVISDAGVGVLAAHSALRSAALNVLINAPLLKDRQFAQRALDEISVLQARCAEETEAVVSLVRQRL